MQKLLLLSFRRTWSTKIDQKFRDKPGIYFFSFNKGERRNIFENKAEYFPENILRELKQRRLNNKVLRIDGLSIHFEVSLQYIHSPYYEEIDVLNAFFDDATTISL